LSDYTALVNPRPEALVICGIDPRLKLAITQFIKEELRLAHGKFIQVSVAGGPAFLAHKKTDADGFYSLTRQIYFSLKHFESIKRIIIIGQNDCDYYKTITNHSEIIEKEKKDLPKATKAILELLKQMGRRDVLVESFYANFSIPCFSRVSFIEIME